MKAAVSSTTHLDSYNMFFWLFFEPKTTRFGRQSWVIQGGFRELLNSRADVFDLSETSVLIVHNGKHKEWDNPCNNNNDCASHWVSVIQSEVLSGSTKHQKYSIFIIIT